MLLVELMWISTSAQVQATKQEVKNAAMQAISDFITPENISNEESIDTVYTFTRNGHTILFEVVFSSGNVMLFSGSKQTPPVLAFYRSYNGKTMLNGISEHHGCWSLIEGYTEQIEASFELVPLGDTIHDGWYSLLNNQSLRRLPKTVQPMISSKWGQDISNDRVDCHAYNYYTTATSNNCNCDHVGDYCPAGCGAVAIGQIMNYWKYPVWKPDMVHQFDWCHMADSLVSHSDHYTMEKYAIAHLLINIGISCNMSYCINNLCASGASDNNALLSLTGSYMYSSDAALYNQSTLGSSGWVRKIRKELAEGRPVYYSASSTSGDGHAFVCDGYDANGLFHFNFGWNGEGDGYYYLDDLFVNGQNYYPFDHQAIMGIHPSTAQDYCNFELPLWTHYHYYYNIYNNTTPSPYANVPKTFTRLVSVPNDPQFPSSWRTIPAGATSEYVAHEEILLIDGFYAETGSDFYVHIVPCESCEEGRMTGEISDAADTLAAPKSLHTETTDIPDDAALSVYPNPAGDLLHIELRGAEIANVALYDLQGRVVETRHGTSLQGGTATVNLRNVPAGVYLLRVRDAEGKEYMRKIVKK